MNIISIKAYNGRNIYSHQKVIKMILKLDKKEDVPTSEIPCFNDRLLENLPGLYDHYCSKGHKGGFIERLNTGTYLPHVIEHIAIEIQNCIGYNVSYGKTRQTDDDLTYNLIYSYECEQTGIDAGIAAVEFVKKLCTGEKYDINQIINRIKEKDIKYKPGPSTQAIINAAQERGIPITQLGNGGIIQLGYGKYLNRIEATIAGDTNCIASDIACDKSLTKSILYDAGIPVPDGGVCYSINDAEYYAQKIGFPVVIKPEDGNQGKEVFLNIENNDELEEVFNVIKKTNKNIIIEKQITGRDYRVLVIGNNVAAVSERIPAHVIGDGQHTVSELVEIVNSDERRGEGHEKPLTKIRVDVMSKILLKKQGFDLSSIPDTNKIVYLKSNGNMSTGGTSIDCTEKIHPFNKEMAIRAARIVGLNIAGIDIVCNNISVPITRENGAVIEVNAAPGIRMHLYPVKGKPRNVAKNIVDMLYPMGNRFSIPIVSVTGTNGKTTTVRMVSHILRVNGLNVGMTTTGGIYINEKCILKGDTTGPSSAKIILTDKSVDAAVLETARGGIVKSGLGYDLCDVGVITNISEDHIGQDGIDSVDDLLNIKSLVVEAVKNNGYAVLNADDPIVVQAAKRVRCNIIYFSSNEDNIILHKHMTEGGISVFLKGNYITVFTGDGLIQIADINQIPAAYGGKLKYNIDNALAAVAVCYGLGVSNSIIEKGLTTFYTDEIQNPGRFNIYNIRDYRVIVDYGHNIAAYKSTIEVLKKMGASRLIGIIGVPGDRRNSIIEQIGFISGKSFQHIIIKEDKDLRGRRSGEVAHILRNGVLKSGFDLNECEIINDEACALKKAMDEAKPGDIIIIYYELLDRLINIIKSEINMESIQSIDMKALHSVY